MKVWQMNERRNGTAKGAQTELKMAEKTKDPQKAWSPSHLFWKGDEFAALLYISQDKSTTLLVLEPECCMQRLSPERWYKEQSIATYHGTPSTSLEGETI